MKTVGSLFTGIAGLDLGLEWAGWTVIWQAETNPYACKVLAKHYPNVPNLGDVTEIDWTDVRRPDLVCAGFPCQPVSFAGARRGTADDRWLWPEVERCVRVVRPEWVLLENVPGLLTLGFGQIATDLAELGYDLRWDCLPAAAVGAPHLRYRVFVVAHADRDGEHAVPVDAEMARTPQPLADTDQPRPQRRQLPPEGAGQRSVRTGRLADTDESGRGGRTRQCRPGWRREPEDGSPLVDTGSGRHRIPDGTVRTGWDSPIDTSWWEFEPDVGRVAHGIPHRVDRLRCLGNAVVPQVAQLVAEMWLP